MASSLTARSSVIAAAAFAAGLFLAPLTASASTPTLSPKVLQCDGSFQTGTATSHPTPTVSVDEQSAFPGLKIGQARISVTNGTTAALWRFDGNFDLTVSACFTGVANGCTAGDSCRTWTWMYNDPNNTNPVMVGRCTYRETINTLCDQPMVLYAGTITNQNVVPLAAACPASTTTLPSSSQDIPITPAGPLPGAPSVGMSSSALQLSGSTLFATTGTATAWDLPATYALSAWINPTSANGRIISQQSATGGWGIAVGATGGLRHFDSRDVSVTSDVTRGSSMVGGWHLVHLVRRNGIDRRFYVDGVLISTTVAFSSNSFLTHSNNTSLEIGRSNAATEFFNGRIDDLRIIYGSLSDDDILLEWNSQVHKYSANGGVTFTTAAGNYNGGPAYGTQLAVNYAPLESYTTGSRWIFLAQSTFSETATSSVYTPVIDKSSPIAPGLVGTPTGPNDITWTWGMPPRVCLPPGSAAVNYNLIDAPSGATLIPPGNMAHPTFTVGETVAGGPNQIVGRRLRVIDTWGSDLSAPTSVYTFANPPLANSVVPSLLTANGVVISWNQNSNPSYTRYLMSYSADATFATGVSTPVPLSANFTGSSVAVSGLTPGTTYTARVQAFSSRSTDSFIGSATVFVSTTFTMVPGGPTLSGTPLSNTSIQWNWSSVTGAQYYKLFDVAGSTLFSGPALTFTQGGLTTNTQYTATVEAVSVSGAGARTSASVFTLANDPNATAVSATFASSITYTWGGNLNPGYTFYEVGVTTDATFAIVVTTLTVNATTATVTGLFPATTYYARVRSINGSQQFGSFVAIASTRTSNDPAITNIAAPPSAYVPPNGAVGQWQFDESTGTTAADSSGVGNTALLTCVAGGCVSTPTFTAGPAGLGTAVVFTGLANGLVRVPDNAAYAFTDMLTVSAWVNPDTTAQPSGAGLIVRGNGGVENFALDVSGALWRFMPKPGFFASSTNTISVGNWTHVTGVYDSVAGTATIYINGRPASTVVGVPARTAAAHDISIGNRQSAAAAYDRGFLGRIDVVRVQHRALNAAEALAEYQGSFVSTVSAPPPNDKILIGLAPNTFGAPANIIVSVDPRSHPVTMTPAVLDAGLTVIPTGFTLVPNSIVEIVPLVGGAPFTQTLGSSASVSIPYSDANGDNIIDGTSPPLAASNIRIYTLNTTVNRWEALPSFYDPANRRITFFTPHFSVFAMFAPSTIGVALSQVRVYPIPWKPGTKGKFDAPGVTFDRLPTSGTVRILTLAGERVREFTFDGNAAGSVVWDGNSDHGRRTASGVYFARITADDGSSALVKFAIER